MRQLPEMRGLEFDAGFVLAAIAVGAFCTALLYCAEVWGTARAQRRTAQAIADAERAGPPEVRT